MIQNGKILLKYLSKIELSFMFLAIKSEWKYVKRTETVVLTFG